MDERDSQRDLLQASFDSRLDFSIVILENQLVLQHLLQAIETAKMAADIVGAPFLIFDTTVQILKVRIKENNRLLGL